MEPVLSQPAGDSLTALTTCHAENRRWSQTLLHHEQEIDQLLALLTDAMEQHNYRSIRHRALDYYEDLKRLRVRYNRLYVDMVCAGGPCQLTNARPTSCDNPRFGLHTLVQAQYQTITEEFLAVKEGCYQFLSVLVELNLL